MPCLFLAEDIYFIFFPELLAWGDILAELNFFRINLSCLFFWSSVHEVLMNITPKGLMLP